MVYELSKRSKSVLSSVHPELQRVINKAIRITKIDFGIPSTGGKRTTEEQYKLYKDGKSNCDGFTVRSMHQTGNAIDVYAYVDGKASWDDDNLTMVAAAILQSASQLGVKLEWGGLWSNFKDYPHFQLK